MFWSIQYKVKGDHNLKREILDLPFEVKWDVIDWWKAKHNSKKDKEIINVSNNGNLNIKENLEGMDLVLASEAIGGNLPNCTSFNQDTDSIKFAINNEDLIEMKPGKFYFKGEEIKDTENVYKRFCEFLGIFENNKINE